VKSHVTAGFRACFNNLPERIQRLARKNYKVWKKDPSHPGLSFKNVGKRTESFSVRIGLGWRALGVKNGNTMIWFWIGSHADYDHLIRNM
jgi:hypothetical protein